MGLHQAIGDIFDTAYKRLRVAAGDGVAFYPEFRDDTLGFFTDVLGIKPWTNARHTRTIPPDVAHLLPDELTDQVLMLKDFDEHDLLAWAGSKGPGKTFLVGGLPLAWLHTRPNSICIFVAGSSDQVAKGIAYNLQKHIKRAKKPLGGKWRSSPRPEYILPNGSYALGLAVDKPDSLLGFHAEAHEDIAKAGPVLVLADELSNVNDAMIDSLWGLTTNVGSKMVWTGNLTKAHGRWHDVFYPPFTAEFADEMGDDEVSARLREAAQFRKRRVTYFDAPTWITDEKYESRIRVRAFPSVTEDKLYRHDILCLPPRTSDDILFPRAFLEAIHERRPETGGDHIGVDVGRHGPDPCVAYLVRNGVPRSVKRWSGAQDGGPRFDLYRTAGIIRGLIEGWKVEPQNVHIDATGMGWGVCDVLWAWGFSVDCVDFGRKIDETHDKLWSRVLGQSVPDFSRTRDSLYWIVRRLMDEGMCAVPLVPAFGLLWDDLMHTPEKSVGGKFHVPDKDSIKDELGRSPDDADAFVVAFSRQDSARVRLSVLDHSRIALRPSDAEKRRAARLVQLFTGGGQPPQSPPGVT